MKMNFAEKLAMNNPIRAIIQRSVEMPILAKMGRDLSGLYVLEIGCGTGHGSRLMLENLNVRKVSAIDFDPKMVEVARNRLSRFPSDILEVSIGDVTDLNFADKSFDAVINFAALHHVSNWQLAIEEVYRVLKPGGEFWFEEVTEQWIKRWPYRVIFRHPIENRFSASQFRNQLERATFQIGENWAVKAGGDFVFGVGKKAKKVKKGEDRTKVGRHNE